MSGELELHLGVRETLGEGLVPFLATAQQFKLYRSAREVLYSAPGSRRFISKVKRNGINHPDQVTELYESGESGGTGKEFRCAQAVAAFLLDSDFRAELKAKTGKLPKPHYLSLCMGLRELRGEGGVVSPHPYYTPEEFARNSQRLALTLAAARVNLPKIYPEYVNFLLVETPISLMGDMALMIGRNTFVDLRKTNPQAQQEASSIRDYFYPNLSPWVAEDEKRDEEVAKKLLQYEVEADAEVGIEEMAWNMGNKDLAERGRNWANNEALSAQDHGSLKNTPDFSRDDLSDPDLRNEIVIPALFALKLRQWGVSPSHGFIGDAPYISEKKHYFWKLLHAHELDMRKVREFTL